LIQGAAGNKVTYYSSITLKGVNNALPLKDDNDKLTGRKAPFPADPPERLVRPMILLLLYKRGTA
jgi:hypothetical protein